MARLKRDEITKIEERNDRIREILAELAIAEEIFIPNLDDDEVPEKVIQVSDAEVKGEKASIIMIQSHSARKYTHVHPINGYIHI